MTAMKMREMQYRIANKWRAFHLLPPPWPYFLYMKNPCNAFPSWAHNNMEESSKEEQHVDFLVEYTQNDKNNEEKTRIHYVVLHPEEEKALARISKALYAKSQKLDLSHLQLQRVPESIQFLWKILKLDLSNNNLETIPECVSTLVNLRILDVSSNKLKELPESIGMLENLKILNVSKNALVILPDTIQNISALEELNAEENKLRKLPETMGFRLRHIRKICIHSNLITELPASTGCMKSLHILDVHGNKLRCLPDDIGRLESLEELDVSKNFHNLTSIPDSIGALENLMVLDLSYDNISMLPDNVGALIKLQHLGLHGNPLIVPPREIVDHSIEAVKRYMAKRLRKSGNEVRKSGNKKWLWKIIACARPPSTNEGLCWDEYRTVPLYSSGTSTPTHMHSSTHHSRTSSYISAPSSCSSPPDSPRRLSFSAPHSPTRTLDHI